MPPESSDINIASVAGHSSLPSWKKTFQDTLEAKLNAKFNEQLEAFSQRVEAVLSPLPREGMPETLARVQVADLDRRSISEFQAARNIDIVDRDIFSRPTSIANGHEGFSSLNAATNPAVTMPAATLPTESNVRASSLGIGNASTRAPEVEIKPPIDVRSAVTPEASFEKRLADLEQGRSSAQASSVVPPEPQKTRLARFKSALRSGRDTPARPDTRETPKDQAVSPGLGSWVANGVRAAFSPITERLLSFSGNSLSGNKAKPASEMAQALGEGRSFRSVRGLTTKRLYTVTKRVAGRGDVEVGQKWSRPSEDHVNKAIDVRQLAQTKLKEAFDEIKNASIAAKGRVDVHNGDWRDLVRSNKIKMTQKTIDVLKAIDPDIKDREIKSLDRMHELLQKVGTASHESNTIKIWDEKRRSLNGKSAKNVEGFGDDSIHSMGAYRRNGSPVVGLSKKLLDSTDQNRAANHYIEALTANVVEPPKRSSDSVAEKYGLRARTRESLGR